MRQNYKIYKEDFIKTNDHLYESQKYVTVNWPLKSPSPDKKSNAIVSTKSPVIQDFAGKLDFGNEQMSPIRHLQTSNLKSIQRINTTKQEPQFSSPTLYNKNQDLLTQNKRIQDKLLGQSKFYHSTDNLRTRNIKIQITAEQTFNVQLNSSQYKSQKSNISQLQYLKMLKLKEQQIRRLAETLEMRDSYEFKDSISNLRSEIIYLKDLNQKLRDQNQGLKRSLQNNEEMPLRQKLILLRQIKELKESLRDKDLHLEDIQINLRNKLEHEKQQRRQLQAEYSASKLINEKDSKGQYFEKLDLIKQKHRQNIEMTKDIFNSQIKQIQAKFICEFQNLENKINLLNQQVSKLEYLKNQAGHLKQQKKNYQSDLQTQQNQNISLYQSLTSALKEIEKLKLQSNTVDLGKNQDELTRLRQQSVQIVKRNQSLQQEVKKNIQLIEQIQKQKQQQINSIQAKISIILVQYEQKITKQHASYEQKIAKLEEAIRKRQDQSIELKQAHQNEKNQIQKQLKKVIQLYNKENLSLKMELANKSQQINTIQQNNLQNDNQLSKVIYQRNLLQRKCAEEVQKCTKIVNQITIEKGYLEEKIQICEQQIRDLKKELIKALITSQQLQQKQLQLQNQQKTNQELMKQLQQSKRINAQKERQFNEITYHLQKDLQNTKFSYDNLDRQHQILKKQWIQLKYGTLQEELKSLKKVIIQDYSRNRLKFQSQIKEVYKINQALELKIQQNLRLRGEIQQLKMDHLNSQKEQLLLTEKIYLLQKNIEIYQRQLKQRKIFLQNILQQKLRIQKEAFLQKRIKAQKMSQQQGFNQTLTSITFKIDRLVQIQKQRCKQINNITTYKYAPFTNI